MNLAAVEHDGDGVQRYNSISERGGFVDPDCCWADVRADLPWQCQQAVHPDYLVGLCLQHGIEICGPR